MMPAKEARTEEKKTTNNLEGACSSESENTLLHINKIWSSSSFIHSLLFAVSQAMVNVVMSDSVSWNLKDKFEHKCDGWNSNLCHSFGDSSIQSSHTHSNGIAVQCAWTVFELLPNNNFDSLVALYCRIVAADEIFNAAKGTKIA